MKKLFWFIIVISFIATFAFAERWSWWAYGSNPIEILDKVAGEANADRSTRVQNTALDAITDTQWWYQSQYKIANTLDWIRNNINPYLQRIVYIGLAIAVILLIYNWFLMVTNSLHGAWDIAKVKKNLINILIGVLILTWFYLIIKIVVWLINSIFWSYWWETWF